MTGKSRRTVCRNSPAGITSWSRPSSTPSKRKHPFSHTNTRKGELWYVYTAFIPLCNTSERGHVKAGWELDDRNHIFLAGISRQVALQNTSSSFSLKTTLPWLRPSICWQSGSSRWVRSRLRDPAMFSGLGAKNKKQKTLLRLLPDGLSLMCNFFIWPAGVEPAQVQERVENHLKSLLIKHFDPQKADSIFTVEGEVRFLNAEFTNNNYERAKGVVVTVTVKWSSYRPNQPCVVCFQTPAWLEQMIAHTTWRDLFYKLAEAHPDCLMLNFTVKVRRQPCCEWREATWSVLSINVWSLLLICCKIKNKGKQELFFYFLSSSEVCAETII